MSYESKEKDPLKAAKAMIKELKKPSEEIEYTPPIPKDVKVKRYELEEESCIWILMQNINKWIPWKRLW